jgi:hypothetical protein
VSPTSRLLTVSIPTRSEARRAPPRETDAEDIAVASAAIEEVLPISERNDDVALVIVHVS